MNNNEPRDASIRRQQNEVGRRMITGDSLREDLRHGDKRRKSSSKPKEDVRGHEALLRTLEAAGCEIQIDLRDVDLPVVGKVKRSDKYSISLEVVEDGGTPRTKVYFKSAMIGFTVLSESPYQQAKREAAQG